MSRTNRQLPQNSPMPPSMTQQSNQAAQAIQNTMSNLDFTEPPDVQIIESSCKLADFKNESNNKWTNVLKEPITIKKGSQIRVASSFTDMRGMDSEIIQFVDKGNQQDNSHTIMTQLYTTNDGVNGKTTSYDYIAHANFLNALEVLVRGNQYAIGNHISTTSGSGTGFEVNIISVGANTSLVRNNINITAEGEGYRTGDAITSNPAGFIGVVIADDLGRMKNFFINNGGSFAAATAITFSVSSSSGGSGATISGYTVPALLGGIPNTIGISQEGSGYKPGDTITITNNVAPGSTNLEFYVLSTGPNGEIFGKSFFDQGYNYQRAPVFRWAQTFDVSDNLCYGRNFKNRSYTAENGQEVSIYNNPPAMLEDVRLSCGDVIQNKEDEFVSGVFHKQGQGKEFLLKKCKQQFFSYPFELINTEGYTYLNIPYQDKTIIDSYGNELTIQESPGNQFANGMGISITFGMQDGELIPDTAHFNTLHENIIKNWAGVYTVGFTYNINSGINIDGVDYDRYVKIVIGANQNFNGNDKWKGVLNEYQFFGTGAITGYPAESLQTLPFINETREDGNPMTGIGGTVRVEIDSAGTGWESFEAVDGGTGYRVGDQLKLLNQDGTDSGIIVLVLLVDNVGGIRASAPQGTSLTRGTMAALGPFEMRVAQNPWYLIGKGNVINRPGDGTFDDNPNAVGILKTNDRLGSNTCFEGYEGVYPPTMENLGIEKSSDIPLANEFLSATGYSGLFKPNGQYPFYNSFNNLNAVFSLHSEKAYLQINENNNNKTIFNFTANVGGGGDNDFTNFNDSDNQLQFSITKAKWLSLGQTAETLPQTYVKLLYTNNNSDNIEEHIYIQYWYDDGTNYVCNIRCRNIHQSQVSVTESNIANWDRQTSMRTNVDPNIYNVKSGELIEFQYLTNDFTFCDNILVNWGFGTNDSYPGSIGMTATQNFFANSDTNKDVLLTSKDWEGVYNGTSVSTDVLNSYNNGGFYYLTHAKEMLADAQNNFKDKTNYFNQMAFAQGMNEWAFTDYIENSFTTGNDYLLKKTEFRTSLVTTCQSVWEYEPFYTQKTFKIPQNFSVPSAIGAWWTRESHKLTGARDMANGNIILEKGQCGLLQNEFVLPVYGANNRIGTGGEYLEDNILYPDSSGLEPGHCIGRLGVDQNATYLATEMMKRLPIKQIGQVASFYNIFFRTFFTIVRNYDPLKNSGSNPDRAFLKTIATVAKNIGNVNDSKASPPITGRTALDGTPMIDIDTGGTPDKSNYKLYELGTPNPAAADTPAFFGNTSTEYPVRYIENDSNNTYGRAKASNFIGSDNLTLAYQTDLSAFTFQFFHQPFTSPFVDNSGGDISCRVFYGNRKIGVQNHDSFGGNNVANWCRPQFPQGTFTFEEILNNITTPDFGNGVNPLKSVDEVGRRFFQKLGYTSQDLGIQFDRFNKYRLTEQYGNLGIAEKIYQTEIVIDDNSSVNFISYTTDFLSTNFAELDSSDSILSSIPPPESSAGINSHIQRVTPTNGKSNKIINRWGDYIYYPYSLNSQTNSFSTEVSQVRFDNATDAYGSVGGLLLSEANRGMGLPNTQGSTTLVNDSTVPVTLNPDCNIYLSYTVQTNSNFITASELPRKLNHGHMVILTNLIQSPNYTLNNQGRLPGISIINKTFIQGDFILSMGMLTFYAKEDRTLTEITTEIVNNDYSVPTALGDQSTVIYEITNMQPRPEAPPAPIFARQQAAYSILQQMAQATGQNPQGVNKILKTMNDLRGLGLTALRDPNGDDSNVINQLSNYIEHFDIPNMNPRERQEFFATPEGAEFLSQAQNIMSVEENMRVIDAYQQAGEDMNPIQDIIAEVQAHLGVAHGSLPSVGSQQLDPTAYYVDELTGELIAMPPDDPGAGDTVDFPMGGGQFATTFSEQFPESGTGQPPGIDLSSIRGQPGPAPPQTVAGDIEPPKPEAVSESGIGTSIATDE